MENLLTILGKIGFDWQIAFANLVNFLIIFLILRKFAFGPINKVITDRQTKINEGIENAKKAETELLMAEEIRQNKIEEAKMQANTIVGEAQKKGNSIIEASKEEGFVLKASIVSDGEKHIAQKKEMIKSEVEKEAANIIIDGLEKVLRESFTEEQQKGYIKKVLV